MVIFDVVNGRDDLCSKATDPKRVVSDLWDSAPVKSELCIEWANVVVDSVCVIIEFFENICVRSRVKPAECPGAEAVVASRLCSIV